MSTEESSFTLQLDQQVDFRFQASFDRPEVAPIIIDESPPLGADAGPNPSRLLGTAVGHCLSASLLFALRKFKNEPQPMSTRVTVHLVRNEQNRLRIGRMEAELRLGVPAQGLHQFDRVLAQFEDFCVVTQSVRAGIPVNVRVLDSEGAVLKD